jgi:hypothetical protein
MSGWREVVRGVKFTFDLNKRAVIYNKGGETCGYMPSPGNNNSIPRNGMMLL